MIRTILSMAAGYLSILLFNSFSRFIVAVYTKQSFSMTGVSEFPSPLMAWLFTGAGFLFGLIGGFLTCSFAREKANMAIVSLILLLVAAAFITYDIASAIEPLWYIIISPLLKIGGVCTAWYLNSKQSDSLNTQTSL